MSERDTTLTTEQKALTINLDKRKYGAIVEIGAGQEVARQFFSVGAAAGTIAKTMSAYDMQVSDHIYGSVGRYVSRERLMQMLEREYSLVINRLTSTRPEESTFFAYAATVTARSYKQQKECHGWIGIRLQVQPHSDPSDIIMHVRMLDDTNSAQSEALGILGVNIIYGAYYYHERPEWIVESLSDNLGSDRIEIDEIEFAGHSFAQVENRIMNLHLIQSWLTRAVVFNPDGNVSAPGDLFYQKPVLVIRGTFNPVTKVNVDMTDAGMRQFLRASGLTQDDVVSLAEITMNTLITGDQVNYSDFLARVDLLASLGYTVMISDYLRFFRLRAYLRHFTDKEIGIVLSVRDFEYLFDEKFYEGMEGGILEAFGKLFPDNTHVFVYPTRLEKGGDLITLENVKVPDHLKHLLAYLVENKLMLPIEQYDADILHLDAKKILNELQRGHGEWERCVPEGIAERIIQDNLLGFGTV